MLLAVSRSHQGHFDSLVSIRKGSCPEAALPYVTHSTNSPDRGSQVESVRKARLFYSLTLLALKRRCTHFSPSNLSLWKLRGGRAEGWVENYGTIIIHWKCTALSGQQSAAQPSITYDLFGSSDNPLGHRWRSLGCGPLVRGRSGWHTHQCVLLPSSVPVLLDQEYLTIQISGSFNRPHDSNFLFGEKNGI